MAYNPEKGTVEIRGNVVKKNRPVDPKIVNALGKTLLRGKK